MTDDAEAEDRFRSIYASRANEYHQLVAREDAQGNLPAALRDPPEKD
jgi:hypothetical protein